MGQMHEKLMFSTMALWHIVKCVAIFQRHPDMKEKLFSQPAHG